MKTICFLAIAIFVSIVAHAQATLKNPLELMEFNQPVSTIKIPTQPVPTLITISPLGKVYAMPSDNMPCLVPNFPADNGMPSYNLNPQANPIMPNPIPRQQFPASAFFNNHLLKIKETPKIVSKNLMLDLTRKNK